MPKYLTTRQITNRFGLSQATVYRRRAGIKKEKERYGVLAVLPSSVYLPAFLDYEKWHLELNNPKFRDLVPKYDAKKILEQYGGE